MSAGSTGWYPGEVALLTVLSGAARGPRRGGVFALWLTMRVAMTLCDPNPLPDRTRKRHLAALKRRLSSLSVPPGLRQALDAALHHLQDGTADAAAMALGQLVAPAEELLAEEAGKALSRAADTARRVARAGRAG
jgi:hypothetical protein